MDEIDNRSEPGELSHYSPQSMYQPVIAWVIFAIVTLGAALFILFQGRMADEAIRSADINSQLASEPDQLIQTSAISSFESCQAAGYPIREIFPEQCEGPDGTVYTRAIIPGEWIIYENDELGFSFLHPPDWESIPVEKSNSVVAFRSLDHSYSSDNQDGFINNGYLLNVYVLENDQNISIDDAFLNNLQKAKDSNGINYYQTTIDGYPAVIQYGGTVRDPNISAKVFTKEKEYLFELLVEDPTSPVALKTVEILRTSIDITPL